MTEKQEMSGNFIRTKLLRGVSMLADVVKITLGPRGRSVLIEKAGESPRVTRSGSSVSREIVLEDSLENIGAQMVKEVASQTIEEAGSGATVTTILAQAILKESVGLVAAGMSPIDVKRGIDIATNKAVEAIRAEARTADISNRIEAVSITASNGESEIGYLITEAFRRVGYEGVISVEPHLGQETIVDFVEGMQIERGYLSPYFVTNSEKMIGDFENCMILLYEKKISSIQPLTHILEAVLHKQCPLLIIAEDIEGEALATLVVNKIRGELKVSAIKAPGFGDRRTAMLHDIAVLTGGQVISDDMGMDLSRVTIEMLGNAARVTVTKDATTIIGGYGKKKEILSAIGLIRRQIEKTTSDYDREKLQERLAKLAGGVAIIRVGGITELDVKERVDHIENALNATRSALQEGVVAGGGVALFNAVKSLDELEGANSDQNAGIAVLRKALEAPLRQIAENAGVEGALVAEVVREAGDPNFGFNAHTKEYGNMFAMGVVDPAKAVRVALQNASSVAGLLIMTEGATLPGRPDVPLPDDWPTPKPRKGDQSA